MTRQSIRPVTSRARKRFEETYAFVDRFQRELSARRIRDPLPMPW